MYRVLVVDDDMVLQDSVKQALLYHNFSVDCANNGREAISAVYKIKYDLVVMDVNMPEMDGITALKEIKSYDPSIIVLILTAYSNVSDAVNAVKEGAYNYLEKPILSENLVALIKRALKAKSLVETSLFSAPTLSLGKKNDDKFVGQSNEMKKIFSLIGKLAKVNTPVLIRGESGTGKELVARAIHFNGPRKDNQFITINLAAIPDNLIESELFGYEKGAFTGADERKIGKFQYANGGTIFLDEIGDVTPAMQIKLLRVLEEQTFTPIGSHREVHVDIRIIAASHRPFEEMIKVDKFREDLFYRLNVLPVYLPPLRDRKSDIPHLFKYYIDYFNGVHGLDILDITEVAKKVLINYDWPGNIRELRNVIEHAFIIETGDLINITSLPDNFLKGLDDCDLSEEVCDGDDLQIDFNEIKNAVIVDTSDKQLNSDTGKELSSNGYSFTFAKGNDNDELWMDFQMAKDLFEQDFLKEALTLNVGKINKTAIKANIPKKTLLRKIEKYNINPKDYY